ncbi:MAG: signal peptidase II, partial [Candidatus Zixiibacteriota bacterium]
MVAIAAADQLSKVWAVNALSDGRIRQVLGTFFQLKLVYNQGGVMGSDLGSGAFYMISSLFVLIFVFYFIYFSKHNRLIAYPMAVVAGGAIGNIIDRLRLGQVVDFLDLDFFDISLGSYHLERWWTFNIADAAITVGVIFVVIALFLTRKSARTADQSPTSNSPA